jgi:hypothetical protein
VYSCFSNRKLKTPFLCLISGSAGLGMPPDYMSVAASGFCSRALSDLHPASTLGSAELAFAFDSKYFSFFLSFSPSLLLVFNKSTTTVALVKWNVFLFRFKEAGN